MTDKLYTYLKIKDFFLGPFNYWVYGHPGPKGFHDGFSSLGSLRDKVSVPLICSKYKTDFINDKINIYFF